MRGEISVAPKEKSKPVVIAHMRLDHALSMPNEAKQKQGIARAIGPFQPEKHPERLAAKETAEATANVRRIKTINAYLGNRENALAELKLKGSPMALLIEKASAKGEELMAAQEIELAWFALAGSLMFKPLSMERTSPGVRPDWPQKTIKAIERYQAWANFWSARKKAHLDYTLPCVIGAVIDQRPIRVIAEEMGFDFRKVEHAVIRGLREYAVRAGWVDGKLAQAWMDEALKTFAPKSTN